MRSVDDVISCENSKIVFLSTLANRHEEIDSMYLESPLTYNQLVEDLHQITRDVLKEKSDPNFEEKLKQNQSVINRIIETWVKNAEDATNRHCLFVSEFSFR